MTFRQLRDLARHIAEEIQTLSAELDAAEQRLQDLEGTTETDSANREAQIAALKAANDVLQSKVDGSDAEAQKALAVMTGVGDHLEALHAAIVPAIIAPDPSTASGTTAGDTSGTTASGTTAGAINTAPGSTASQLPVDAGASPVGTVGQVVTLPANRPDVTLAEQTGISQSQNPPAPVVDPGNAASQPGNLADIPAGMGSPQSVPFAAPARLGETQTQQQVAAQTNTVPQDIPSTPTGTAAGTRTPLE